MYQVYIDTPSSFEPVMMGEFVDFDKAVEFAEKEKASGTDVTYTIEETCGTFNSYGEQITNVVKRG